MSEQFNAILAEEIAGKQIASLKTITLEDLPDEDVLVEVHYSTLNYKDGLAVSGMGRICRSLPLICGIDLVGTVIDSRDDRYQKGDHVLVNGFGMSETVNGGYSQYQRVRPEWIVRVPDGMSLKETMAVGTAGYTSMLCIQALQDAGIEPSDGPILVTGAAGGVGSVAVSLLAKLGYEVHASTGRIDAEGEFLRGLGAKELVPRQELSRDCKPLEREIWAGVIDTVGDKTLATALAQTRYGGTVAACGLAGGSSLPTTVMPFILRGVTLRGIDSVMAPQAVRQRAWNALDELLDREHLKRIYKVIPMSSVPDIAADIVRGKVKGRLVVDVNA